MILLIVIFHVKLSITVERESEFASSSAEAACLPVRWGDIVQNKRHINTSRMGIIRLMSQRMPFCTLLLLCPRRRRRRGGVMNSCNYRGYGREHFPTLINFPLITEFKKFYKINIERGQMSGGDSTARVMSATFTSQLTRTEAA